MADPAEALARLDEITRRLRRDCPWDREQDERSIVPHTIEEAYELADAAHSGDDAKLVDELGDVLFQVYFLSLLLEERGASSLAEVAEAIRTKLVRRHPHVFGRGGPEAPRLREAADADAVRRNWDEIKRDEEGAAARDPFAGIPDTLPATLYAKKVLRRAGGHVPGGRPAEGDFEALGDALLEVVRRTAEAGVDPELALRAAAGRFAAARRGA